MSARVVLAAKPPIVTHLRHPRASRVARNPRRVGVGVGVVVRAANEEKDASVGLKAAWYGAEALGKVVGKDAGGEDDDDAGQVSMLGSVLSNLLLVLGLFSQRGVGGTRAAGAGRGGASADRESVCAPPDAIGVTEDGAAGCPPCTVTDACAAAGATTSSK